MGSPGPLHWICLGCRKIQKSEWFPGVRSHSNNQKVLSLAFENVKTREALKQLAFGAVLKKTLQGIFEAGGKTGCADSPQFNFMFKFQLMNQDCLNNQLIGVFMNKTPKSREEKDPKVKPWGPMGDVIKIVLEPFAKGCVPPPSMDLGPTSDSDLD